MAANSQFPSSLEKRLALTLLTLMSGQRLMNFPKQTKSASSSLKAILDVDHKDPHSEIVQNLLRQFPTYAEVSPKRLHSGWYLKDYELNEKELSSLRL